MPLQTISAPRAEPLSLAEAKLHSRISTRAEDSLVASMIAAVRKAAQLETKYQVVAASYRLVMDSFPGNSAMNVPFGRTSGLPGNAILLPVHPVLQVDSITYQDMAGSVQTVPPANYALTLDGVPRIAPVFGQIWQPSLPQIGAVQVNFRAGACTPLFADSAAGTIRVPGWKTMAAGDALRVFARDKDVVGDGALPEPLQPMTDYFVAAVAGVDTYTIAETPGGDPIELVDNGTGELFIGDRPHDMLAWMRLTFGSLYDNRESFKIDQQVVMASASSSFLGGLLDSDRLNLY